MLIKPGLYIVSTPIGNMEDITIRALNILKQSNIILCEDTRVSQKLLAKHGIKTRLMVYNDYSEEKQRTIIIELVAEGNIISFISDAGTPLVSDPGYKLVKLAQSKGLHIDIAPGVSAPIAALTLSGLPTDRFLFAGFLPKTSEGKKKLFAQLANVKATLIFFETATRLNQSLLVAKETLGNREACVARELTKLHQEIKSERLDKIIEFYSLKIPRGEIVLLISGEPPPLNEEAIEVALEKTLILHLTNGLSAKSATEAAYQKFSKPCTRKEIYSKANKLKEKI